MLICNIDQCSVQVAVCEPVSHRQVLIQVIAAISRGGAGNLIAEIADKGEHIRDKRRYFAGGVVPCKEHIETGTASHGAEVDRLVREFGMISQEGGAEVLTASP